MRDQRTPRKKDLARQGVGAYHKLMTEPKNTPDAQSLAKIGRSEKLWVAALGAFSGIVGAALTYSVVAWFDYQNRDRELDLELAKVGPLDHGGGARSRIQKNPYPARRFAVDALERGTGVKIDEALKDEWAKTGNVEFGRVPVSRLDAFVDNSALNDIIEQISAMDQCINTVLEGGGAQDAAVRACRDATSIGLKNTPAQNP